jgi:hypothetical protein
MGIGAPSNNEMNLTKPTQAMELRRLSQCWTDLITCKVEGATHEISSATCRFS